jgi:chromosomal replication initiator protein
MSDHDERSPEVIWQTAYGELQLQMPRETFDTWLRNARLIAHEDGTYVLGVQNIYAREWLEHRLKKPIVRTLSHVAGRSVEVRFVLWADHGHSADLREAGPLLADLDPDEETSRSFEPPLPGETGLNPRYTFETYAIGANNRLAHAAAQAAVETPATQFNPLVIHAGIGLGKTHLLHAIGNACAQWERRVRFASAETFTNDLVAAIRARRTEDFRAKYRTAEVLLIDDVQFIAGKESTQEEFYHTFNHLFEGGAQIVVASSDPPSTLRALDARLASRFEGGLVAEILPPDFETRLDILRIKAGLRGFDGRIPLEVLEMIAEESEGSSARDLEGALNRVIAAAMLHQEVPTLGLAKQVFQQMAELRARSTPSVGLEDVIAAVAEYYGLTPDDLAGRERTREVASARQVIVYLARELADASLAEIGGALGGRNHSTMLYSYEKVADLMQTDSLLRRQVQAITQMLRQGTPTKRSPRRNA